MRFEAPHSALIAFSMATTRKSGSAPSCVSARSRSYETFARGSASSAGSVDSHGSHGADAIATVAPESASSTSEREERSRSCQQLGAILIRWEGSLASCSRLYLGRTGVGT
jgi:hypothetical protein